MKDRWRRGREMKDLTEERMEERKK